MAAHKDVREFESFTDRKDVCQWPQEPPLGGQRILRCDERSPWWTSVRDCFVERCVAGGWGSRSARCEGVRQHLADVRGDRCYSSSASASFAGWLINAKGVERSVDRLHDDASSVPSLCVPACGRVRSRPRWLRRRGQPRLVCASTVSGTAHLQLHAVGVTKEQRPLIAETLDLADFLSARVRQPLYQFLEHDV